MNLLMAPVNRELCIERIKPGNGNHGSEGRGNVCGQERHLSGLGFVKGASIRVLNEVNGNLIVRIKDSKVAIDRCIARKIIVGIGTEVRDDA